jgi:hypothetical protein
MGSILGSFRRNSIKNEAILKAGGGGGMGEERWGRGGRKEEVGVRRLK